MAISGAKRTAWQKKLRRLAAAQTAAQEGLLVAIFEATQDGVSQSDVAYMADIKSPSTIKAKADKGKAILEQRTAGQ